MRTFKLPQSVSETYFCGKCMYFAAALSSVNNWRIDAFVDDDGHQRWIDHAWCISDNGIAIDINGESDPCRMVAISSGVLVRGLSLEELIRLTGCCERVYRSEVESALRIINKHIPGLIKK